MSLTNPRWLDVSAEGEETGTQYVGRFQLKPFLKQFEKTEAYLLGQSYTKGLPENHPHSFYLNMMAFLKFHIVSADASWWVKDGLDIVDEAPGWELAKKLKEFQTDLKPKKPETETKTEG